MSRSRLSSCIPPPLKLEEDAIPPMTEQETGTPEDSSRTNNSGGLGDLELEGLDLAVASPEAGAEEEDKINNTTTEEFPVDGGHEESEQEAVKWDYEEGEKIYEA